jgi:hypothetical protein
MQQPVEGGAITGHAYGHESLDTQVLSARPAFGRFDCVAPEWRRCR